ncbi:MAG: FtsX-like permease family protein, partial [Halothiobacillus sp.]|nr:FtsX-like permease family protein [Halothiobacillus sp.]
DGGHRYMAIARLQSGVTREQAALEMQRVTERLREQYPGSVADNASGRFIITDYQALLVGKDLRRTLWVLLGAVGFVLLIVATNVASLFQTRVAKRRREMAVRAALGAERVRLVRQLLTESLILGLAGGVVGLILAWWTLNALLTLAPPLPRANFIGLDMRVLGFTMCVSLLTALAFGLATAVPGSCSNMVESLREGGYSGGGNRAANRGRGLLVATQAALAVILLAGAGLLVGTFVKLRAVDLGFQPEHVITASFDRTPSRYDPPEARWAFQQQLLERIRALPGVRAAAVASNIPFQQGLNIPVTVAGDPQATEGAVEWRAVSPEYFDVMGIPILRGQKFTDIDRQGTVPVVIINESYARRYFSDRDPIGERLLVG